MLRLTSPMLKLNDSTHSNLLCSLLLPTCLLLEVLEQMQVHLFLSENSFRFFFASSKKQRLLGVALLDALRALVVASPPRVAADDDIAGTAGTLLLCFLLQQPTKGGEETN